MHALYQRGKKGDDRLKVPTLYVRSLASFGGPEYALRMIFQKARQEAPCYLVFEDLDSIVNDQVRSYFLNEVDGLKSNDGILMVGSTNHLDRLDPGISKRPSRFDRKYYFPDPDFDQRVQYAKFWQGKLSDNEDVKFPDDLCPEVAKITDGFSFAYMQEAFVASLLAIAIRKETSTSTSISPATNKYSGPEDPLSLADEINNLFVGGGGGDDLDDLVLWRELKKQIRILRDEMEEKRSQIKPGKSTRTVAAKQRSSPDVRITTLPGPPRTRNLDHEDLWRMSLPPLSMEEEARRGACVGLGGWEEVAGCVSVNTYSLDSRGWLGLIRDRACIVDRHRSFALWS